MSAAELAGSDEDMDFEGESAGFTAGSPVSQDWFQIDDSRFEESTGFLGKASTVRWIEDVGEKVLDGPDQDTLEQTSILISPASFQYLFVDIKSPQGG
jgi:hypothetical protein